MQETRGAVRADLVGGTLDLSPLNLQIPNIVTINMALDLEACVVIEKSRFEGVEIFSKDYNKDYQFPKDDFNQEKLYFTNDFSRMTFVGMILKHLGLIQNIKVTLSSGAPAGSGLGGSSTMGVTLYKAIKRFKNEGFDRLQAIKEVQQIEAVILKAGVAGYQDYYPAMFGGVLALHPQIGLERVEQLANNELNEFLESNISLVFSGVSRDSGINNWEVYKKFYDKDEALTQGLYRIAEISQQAYQAVVKRDYPKFLKLIIKEGEARADLFPSILGEKIQGFRDKMLKMDLISGIKICGAGGGGCFLAIHPGKSRQKLDEQVTILGMKLLPFKVGETLE